MPRPVQLSPLRATVVGAAMVTVSGFSIELYTPTMPSLVSAFGTDVATIKLSVTLYLLGFALSQLLVGSLSDAIGRRPVAIGFLGLYLGGSLLALFAPSVAVFLMARLIQGVGMAVTQTIARALVRDCFTGRVAAGVMNSIGVALAVAPLVAPTLGGSVVQFFGWQATFVLMALQSAVVLGLIIVILPETAPSTDIARLKPWTIMRDYFTVARDSRFMRLALANGFVLGTLYAGPSMLPFLLIGRIGLTPTQFGLSMLLVGGGYILGTQIFRVLLNRRIASVRLLTMGILVGLSGCAMLLVLLNAYPPTLLSVMVPVGIIALSTALLLPIASTEALQPFPDKAGTASALIGFAPIVCGLLGSLTAAQFPDPVRAVLVVYPGMVILGALSLWLIGRGSRRGPVSAGEGRS